jgi:transposase
MRMRSDGGDGQDKAVRVTVGVDTHADLHVGVALDRFGRRLGARSVPTTPAGFTELVAWASDFGVLEQVGVEGAGSYGAGLARWLRARGVTVVEVERPHRPGRQERRRRGKSDPLDAEAAARAVQAGVAIGQPKAGDGEVEMIRTLRLARRSALKARTQAANPLHAPVVTAPDELRARLRALPLAELVTRAAALRPARAGTSLATPAAATKLGRRVAMAAPARLAVKGIGTDTAPAPTSPDAPPTGCPSPRSFVA